jgi:amino acid adenylation domain-containing protein/non-ribosomal peptide synthase protein (TIGR01720 family)
MATFPLSLAQERLWFFQRLVDGSSGLEVTGSLSLRGRLDTGALASAIDELQHRHEILRTVFPSIDDGRPVQVVCSPIPSALRVEDSEAHRVRAVATRLSGESHRGFNVVLGPVWRMTLFATAPEHHLLGVSLHHLIADAWSVRLLVGELVELYRARLARTEAALPPLPFQYADYAVWQREQIERNAFRDGLAYWQRQLAGLSCCEVPIDRQRPKWPRFASRVERRVVPGMTSRDLEDLCARAKVTPFMVLFGALAVQLARVTNRADVCVLSPVANRSGGGLETCAGCFVNLVALRMAVDASASFRALLARARSCVLEAQEWQHVPFDTVAATLNPERRVDRAPFSTVGFVCEPNRSDCWTAGSLEFALDEAPRNLVENDLIVVARFGADGIEVRIEYRTDLFEAPKIQEVLADYVDLLRELVAHPETSLRLLPGGAIPGPRPAARVPSGERVGETLVEVFAERARQSPRRTAVVAPDGQTLDYGELAARAACVGAALRRRGVSGDTVVGVVGRRGISFLVGLLGSLEAGGAFLPLDPDLPKHRLRQMLDGCGVRLLLTDAGSAALADELAQGAGGMRTVVFADDERGETAPDAPSKLEPGERNLAYVIFTSGSAGAPKGVMIEHRGLLNHLRAKVTVLRMTEGDRVAQTAPSSFDVSIWQWFAPLLVGGCVVVMADDEIRDPGRLLDLLDCSGVTLCEVVPTMLRAVVDEIEARGSSGPRLPALRTVVVTGEALPPVLARRWLASHPEIPLVNAYGPTECSDDVTHYEIRMPPPLDQLRVPIGGPIEHVRLYVDEGAIVPVRPGVTGELCVGGAAVARGYVNDALRTAAVFAPDPFAPDPTARLYRTGDLVTVLEDGSLDLLGRRDRQVKIAGCRIELGEIEAVLRCAPDVEDAAVVVRRDDDGHASLVAYVVAPAESELDPRAWLRFLAERLPAQMVPRRFVPLRALPLTPHGKVDLDALAGRDALAREGESGVVPETPTGSVETGARVQDVLRGIWEQVLGVRDIGPDDDFFALGGDSIGSIQVSACARQAGLMVTVQQLFAHPTLARLATVVCRSTHDPGEQGMIVGALPLLPAQAAFFEQAPAAPQRQVMSMRFAAAQRIDVGMLRATVERLTLHHDALRLRFRPDADGWTQGAVLPEGSAPIQHRILPGAYAGGSPNEVDALERELIDHLSLTAGPVVAVAVADDGVCEPSLVVVVVHHLLCDAWSARVLIADLGTILGQLAHGEDIALPSKSTSLWAWRRHLAAYAMSSRCREQLPYWLQQVADEEGGIPIDYPHGRNREDDAETVLVPLDEETTRPLLRSEADVAARERLLGALLHTLAWWTQTSSLVIAIGGHGRDPLDSDFDLSRTVGWIACTYPLRCDLTEARSIAGALAHARDVLKRVPDHGIGYEVLRYLGDDTTALVGQPPPGIKLNYLGTVDGGARVGAPFHPLWRAPGSAGSGLPSRPHVIEVTAFVLGDRLQLAMEYGVKLHRRSTIEHVLGRLASTIRRMCSCRTHERDSRGAP